MIFNHAALLCIARDELDKLEKAKENFKIVLDYNPSHVPGLLGQVLNLVVACNIYFPVALVCLVILWY